MAITNFCSMRRCTKSSGILVQPQYYFYNKIITEQVLLKKTGPQHCQNNGILYFYSFCSTIIFLKHCFKTENKCRRYRETLIFCNTFYCESEHMEESFRWKKYLLTRQENFIYSLGKTLEQTSKFFLLVFATYIELDEENNNLCRT